MGKKNKYRKPSSAAVSPQQQSNQNTNKACFFDPPKDPYGWIVLALLCIVGIGFYFTSFSNGFIWDDTMVITPNEYIRDWSHLKEIFTSDIHRFGLDKSNFYRPLQAISYAIDYTFWELNPMGYHISSVFYHIINSFLLYLLVFSIVGHLDKKFDGQERNISLATALIWLVHPIHTQAVSYAAGRADVLVCLFMLLALYTFATSKRWYLAPICFILALLSKEYAIITPLFIVLFYCFGLVKNKQNAFKTFAPFVVILLIYVVLRLTVLNYPQEVSTAFIPNLFGRLLTSAQAIMILIGLLFAPFDLSMDRNIPWADSLVNLKVIFSILGVIGMIASGFIFRKKKPFISFCLLWFFIGYLLVLNIIKMNANVSEHWMYVPSIGLLLLIFYGIAHIPKLNQKLMIGLISVLVIYFGARLITRNADFKNEITFYTQILNRTWGNARVHYNLGCAYFYEGDNEKSYKHLREAIKFKPNYAAAYGNLGQLEYRKGNIDQAIAFYEKANSIKQDLIENRSNLGTAYSQQGRFKDAIDQLSVALTLNPNHTASLNNMGIAYGRKGEYSQAEKYFKKALSINPEDQAAHNNLNHLYKLMQTN